MSRYRLIVLMTVTTAIALVLTVSPVLADWSGSIPTGNGVVPVYRTDLPESNECGTLGYAFGFKIEGAPNDTFPLQTVEGVSELMGGAPTDLSNSVTISNSDTYTFNWSATLGIDAVVVKAGDGANVFTYAPEATSDTGLYAPLTGTGPDDPGTIREISHITFCYDYELDVSKTANTSYTRTYNWSIDKTPDMNYVGFPGDSWMHEYTITVNQTGSTESDWAVSGDIIIENNTPFTATVTGVTDVISNFGPAPVTCPDVLPDDIAPGGTLTCTYDTGSQDSPNPFGDTNTATVTTTGDVGGGEATAAVNFGNATVTEINAEVNVIDDYGTGDTGDDKSFGPLANGTSVKYSRGFECPTDTSVYIDGMYTADPLVNTATIDETGDYDTATVNVTCYLWDVSKTAEGTYQNQYGWDITKTVEPPSQKGFAGDQLSWTWSITWNSSLVGETNHAVEGVITVTNPATMPLTVDVTDYLTGNVAATVTCNDADFGTNLTIAAGSSGTCDYTAAPTSQLAQNTAVATRNNVSVSDTVDINWTQGSDIGLDAVITDGNQGTIPVNSDQP